MKRYDRWRHQVTADMQLYRNPNLIALYVKCDGRRCNSRNPVLITPSGRAGPWQCDRLADNAILFAPHYQLHDAFIVWMQPPREIRSCL